MNRNFVFLSFWCFVCDACRYKFLAKNFFMRKEATTKDIRRYFDFCPISKKKGAKSLPWTEIPALYSKLFSQIFCSGERFGFFLAMGPKLKYLLRLMPCSFTGPKIFCASPNFLSQSKNLTAFGAYSNTFVSAQKQFYWMQIIFLSGTKCLWLPQYVNKLLVWHEKFGPAQNILGPVKVQGITHL